MSLASEPSNKELIIAINAEFDTLHPVISSMMASTNIQDIILRPLIGLNPKGEPIAVLAQEVPSFKNNMVKLGADKKSLEVQIKIHALAQWDDKTPVTCADLKLAWQIGLSDNVSTPNREEFNNIQSIQFSEKLPKNCSVVFKTAKWNFYLNLPRPIPSHLEAPIFEKYKTQPQAYERNSNLIKNLSLAGVSNGPFKVAEYHTGSHIALIRNPNFWGTPAKIEKIIFKFISNTATMEANLRSGSVHLLSSSGVTFDQALALEKKFEAEKLNYKVLYEPGVIFSHLDLNLDHSILKDVKVRQALNFALDRSEMVSAFFQNKQKAAVHFSLPIDDWYTENPKEISIYKYSLREAKSLLDQAGWRLSPDGVRVKAGQRLTLTISGAADIKLNEMLQSFIQESWQKIGVEVHTKNYPARVLFSEVLRKRNYEVSLYSWVSNPNTSQRSVLHSSQIPSEANAWSGSNRTGWKNSVVDARLDEIETEFDSKIRSKKMKQILKIYTVELPVIPLYYRSNNAVIPASLQGFQMSGHLFSEYLNIENWHF
jgi:peptide/nickel transport system substrate-binding protein